MQPGVVIVGGGQAGLEAAAALRTQGYEGTVTLICEEPHAPYQRPPLSKDFLTGKQEMDRVFLRALAYYEKQRIDLILGDRVTEINRRREAGASRRGRDGPLRAVDSGGRRAQPRFAGARSRERAVSAVAR